MSEKINADDSDSNEPIKHSHYSNGIPTGREFEHLYNHVEKIDTKLDVVVTKIDKICQHMEDLAKSKQEMYKRVGIFGGFFSAIVGVIIAVVSRVWNS